MEIDIVSVTHNPLLGRTEFELEVNHDGEPTPSKDDVKERISAEHDFDSESVDVRSLKTGFGSNVADGLVRVTESVDLERFEDYMEEEPETEHSTSEADEKSTTDADYEEIVSGTISDAKEQLQELKNADYDAALQAEKDGKNRTTFVEWLESQ